MAWDFSTEPEFEEKLSWMRGFVRDEFIPLETLDLDAAAFSRATGVALAPADYSVGLADDALPASPVPAYRRPGDASHGPRTLARQND